MHEIVWWVILIGVLISSFVVATLTFPLHEADGALCLESCRARLAERARLAQEEDTAKPDFIDPDTNQTITTEDYINQAKTTITAKPVYISVVLSEVCKISQKCPTMKWMADMYDNSNKYLSGDFTNDTGEWKRTKPVYPNVFELYRQTNNYLMIFVEPDDYTRSRTKNIFIEPELYQYLDRGQGDLKVKLDMTNNGTKVFNRIVREDYQIENCKVARMGWNENGDKLFSNIVAHFYSGCTRDIGQNNTKIITTKAKIFTDCGPQCQYLNWLKNATESSKKGFLINPNKTISTNEVRD